MADQNVDPIHREGSPVTSAEKGHTSVRVLGVFILLI